jgi:glycosyltransferase involved in cell wall biosynthesis
MPRVSVVIPCFNQGRYLDEAVESVLGQTYADWEVLVVNDGSTEPQTAEILRDYQRPKTRVVHTANQGLPGARNAGIREAAGEYILPLDADDRIGPTYLEQAVRELDADPRLGIVYCEAEYFGGQSGKWEMPPYAFPEILFGNMIFCSAMFRRADWEKVGGYKAAMKHGWEDWELWLSLIELGRGVYRVPETLFYYRRQPGSMIDVLARSPDRLRISFEQVFLNHLGLYADNAVALFRNRWILQGRERLIPRLVPALFKGRVVRTLPARAAATLGLLGWAAWRRLRRSAARPELHSIPQARSS